MSWAFGKNTTVRLIGVDIKAIEKAEDREKFRQWMIEMGIFPFARHRIANSFLEGKEFAQEIGFPLVLRPSFTLGGTGGGIVFIVKMNWMKHLNNGLTQALFMKCWLKKQYLGWKEFELELIAGCNDNVVIICTCRKL